MNLDRIHKLIDRAISDFSLNLSGLTILTEAASGYYALTPLMAALARADCVLALTKDSTYGKATDIKTHTMKLAQRWGVHDKIHVIFNRDDKRIATADIITNLGFVRPIDAPFLQKVKKTAVLPLMWETWEFRTEDLDLNECRRRQIPVLGTDEHHPDLRIFEYIGYIALKLLFEAQIEVFNARIAILGQGEFAEQIIGTLEAVCADVHPIVQTENGLVAEKSETFLQDADALIIVEHHDKNELIGAKGILNGADLVALNKYITILHICGNVDQGHLQKAGIRFLPGRLAPAGYMSLGTDYVGPAPLIRLHVAGLKVGECLAHARKECSNAFDAEMEVLAKCQWAQGFEDYHVR